MPQVDREFVALSLRSSDKKRNRLPRTMFEGTSRIPQSLQIQPIVSLSCVPEADSVFLKASGIDDALLRKPMCAS